jgi:hypothetical protein
MKSKQYRYLPFTDDQIIELQREFNESLLWEEAFSFYNDDRDNKLTCSNYNAVMEYILKLRFQKKVETMTNKDRNSIKKKILKCLTEDFKNNQAIFDKQEGWQVFNGTDLYMVMKAVVKGIEMAKYDTGESLIIKQPKHNI